MISTDMGAKDNFLSQLAKKQWEEAGHAQFTPRIKGTIDDAGKTET